MKMTAKADDFKAKAVEYIGHANAWRLNTRDRHILWRLAFNTKDMTVRDQTELGFIAEKVEPQGAVA